MKRKVASGIMLTLLSMGMLALTFNIQPVRASGTIYIRPDGSVEGTDKIQRDGDVYTFTDNIYEWIRVDRNDIIVDGAGYTLQGTEIGTGIDLSNRSNVTIKNMKIRNFYDGIRLYHSSNNTIRGNYITNNNDTGISLVGSESNSIHGNYIANNRRGLHAYTLQYASLYNIISGNNITNNDYGIRSSHCGRLSIVGNSITNSKYDGIYSDWDESSNIIGNKIANNSQNGIEDRMSANNIICGNNITNNGENGIYYPAARVSANNTISGNNIEGHNKAGIWFGFSAFRYFTIFANNITNNNYGLFFEYWATNNTFYHNNFIDNIQQVHIHEDVTSLRMENNSWDDDYPSGGNYWNDYNGTDTNHDGIGEDFYEIGLNNTDHYPLMGMFHSFNTSLGLHVNVISNSSIRDFEYLKPDSTIKMKISNMTANQTFGFCRVCISHAMMYEPYNVTIDGADPVFWNFTLYDNGTHRLIYFAYQHSTHEIIIQGSDTAPPIVSILSPENKTYTTSSVFLSFTVDEATSWIGYSLDGQANITIAGNTTLSELSDGSYNLIVYAKDTAGNTGASELVHFSIETPTVEPFPTLIVAAIAIIAVVGAVAFVYFIKFKK